MLETVNVLEVYFYRIIAAMVILLVGLTIGLLVKKVLQKILREIEVDKVVKRLGKSYSLEKKLSGLGAYIIYFITLFFVLEQLGITSVVLYIVLGLVLLLMGATFLVGIKDLVPNLVGALAIYRKGYKTGKKIKVNNLEGKINKLGLLEMEIRSRKGDKIYVPNSLLIKSKVWLKR